MRILMHIGLSDRSMANQLIPLTKVENLKKIYVVRDKEGPKLQKIKYFPIKKIPKNRFIKIINRFLLLLKVCKKQNPDYLHAYMVFPWGFSIYLLSKICNREYGISLIAGPVEIYTFGGSPIGKYSYGAKVLPPIPLVHKILNIKILKNSTIITVTGSYTKDFLASLGIDKEKIFIIPHIVDKRFRKKNMQKKYDLVYVGRLVKVKHVEILVEAVNIVKRQINNIKVVVVGEGPERKNLEELVKNYNLQKNIDFVGFKSDIWNWFNISRINILTSEREGVPYSVIESMACGTPVIASNCGDIKDIIIDNYNGLLINRYNDAKTYSKKIIYLLKNPILLERLSQNAVESIKNISLNASEIWDDIFKKIN